MRTISFIILILLSSSLLNGQSRGRWCEGAISYDTALSPKGKYKIIVKDTELIVVNMTTGNHLKRKSIFCRHRNWHGPQMILFSLSIKVMEARLVLGQFKYIKLPTTISLRPISPKNLWKNFKRKWRNGALMNFPILLLAAGWTMVQRY